MLDRKLPENRITVLVLPMIMIVVKIGTFGGADIICLFPVNVIDRRKICPLVFARKAIFAKSHPITSKKIFVSNLGIENFLEIFGIFHSGFFRDFRIPIPIPGISGFLNFAVGIF